MWTWYLTRGSGAAALLLLTGAVVIGIAHTLRWHSRALPRFVVDDLHRVLSVSALALVAAHIVSAVLDSFAPVSVLDAFVPFHGVYRPTWLGLGAIAFDLMLILAVTSAYRARIGYRTWRVIHWAAYACWPPALMHSFGTGSDVKRGWILLLGVGCSAVVAMAVGARLWQTRGPRAGIARTAGVLGMLVAAGGLAAWLPAGPLAHGWARRAGTPLSLLIPKGAQLAAQPTSAVTGASTAKPAVASASQRPVTGEANGVIRAGTDANGTALVDIALQLTNPERRRVDVRIAGAPLDGGGVSLERSQVTFGPPRDPARYLGHLTSLSGTRMSARLTPLHGSAIDLRANLVIDETHGSARGHISVRPIG